MKLPDLTIYGKYLGPFSRGTGPGIDDLDELARIHDLGYSKMPWWKAYFTWNEADEEFLTALRKMDPSKMRGRKRQAYDLALAYFTAKKLKAPRDSIKGNVMAVAGQATGISPYYSDLETTRSMAAYLRPLSKKYLNLPDWMWEVDITGGPNKRAFDDVPPGGYTHTRKQPKVDDEESINLNEPTTDLFPNAEEGILKKDGTFIDSLTRQQGGKVYNLNRPINYGPHPAITILN